MIKIVSFVLVFVVGLFMSGCGGSPKIVIPSYTAPKEVAKLKKIETKDEFISDGAYLALWINPNIEGTKNKHIKSMLIDSVKEKLTETNFITIDPMGGDDGVALNMKVSHYDYKELKTKRTLSMEVTFTLSRGADEFLVKKYHDKKNRQSNDASKLPSQNELTSQAISKIVKYFISDISPLKTYQLREFKSLPSELKYVTDYAKRKNYNGAIKLMNRYNGKKDLNYHYNLAILYEAEASVTENIKFLERAESNYEMAMNLGGINDKVVVDAKAKFDNFYELLSKAKEVDKANQALRDDRNAMTGSSDDEYK